MIGNVSIERAQSYIFEAFISACDPHEMVNLLADHGFDLWNVLQLWPSSIKYTSCCTMKGSLHHESL